MIVSNIKSTSEITRDEVEVICSIKEQYWPHSMRSQLEWWERHTDKNDIFITLVHDALILAFLRLRQGSILVNGKCLVASCVSEVCVSKGYRGQGRGKQLLNAASMYMKCAGVHLGYLLCWAPQAAFYHACGWRQLRAPQVKSSRMEESRALAANEKCMAFDPQNQINGQIILIGDQF